MHLSSVFHHRYCICMLMSCFSMYLYLSSETSTQQCVHMSFVLWSRRAYLCPKDVFFYTWPKTVIVFQYCLCIVPTGLHILFYHADYSLVISSDWTLALMLLRSLVIIVLSALQRITLTQYNAMHNTPTMYIMCCPALALCQLWGNHNSSLPPWPLFLHLLPKPSWNPHTSARPQNIWYF